MNDAIIQLAAAATVLTPTAQRPTVRVLAYSGGLMSVPGWGPVVLDLAGLTAGDKIILLADHDASLRGVIGHGTAFIGATEVIVTGELDPQSPAARLIISKHKIGVPWQASVGVTPKPDEVEQLSPGSHLDINGQQIVIPAGGAKLVRAGTLREVSIVALGADADTTVSIAASAARKVPHMLPETPTTPTTPDPVQQHRDLIAAEHRRIGNIQASLRSPDLQANAIEQGWDDARIALEATREQHIGELRGSAARSPVISSRGATGLSVDILAAAITVRSSGDAFAAKVYDAQTLERSRPYQGMSLVELCREINKANGIQATSSRDEMMRAAMFPHLAANSGFSTMSLPRLLDNSANKSLEQAYREYPASWRTISAVRSANNFKEHRSLRAVLNGTLDSVGNGGEIKHADMDEEAYGFQVLTFAKMLAITRTNIVNDDLSAFSQVPAALGRMAARSLSDLVWKTVLLNTTYDLQTFWQSTNGNIINSPGGELSFDSLSAAIILMRNQQDADGMSLDIRPQTLVVPPALEMTARQLLRSAENQRDVSVDNQGTRNPIADLVANLEVEPRLSNTEFSGASAKKWFLFSSPVNASILVAFLDGRSTPTIESSETDFNTLGMQWRVYHDYGCALGDTRASVMSTGDAA